MPDRFRSEPGHRDALLVVMRGQGCDELVDWSRKRGLQVQGYSLIVERPCRLHLQLRELRQREVLAQHTEPASEQLDLIFVLDARFDPVFGCFARRGSRWEKVWEGPIASGGFGDMRDPSSAEARPSPDERVAAETSLRLGEGPQTPLIWSWNGLGSALQSEMLDTWTNARLARHRSWNVTSTAPLHYPTGPLNSWPAPVWSLSVEVLDESR